MTNTSTTPSRTNDEAILDAAQAIKIAAESLQTTLHAQIDRANTILADIQRRVSALEQKLGTAEPKRTAKVRQAKQ